MKFDPRDVSMRELFIAFVVGGIMGLVGYFLVRHIEEFIGKKVDEKLPG